MAVPLEILICVGAFPIYCDRQSTIGFWFDNGIQEGMAASSLLFSTVNFMARSTLLMCSRKFVIFFLLDDKCVHPQTYTII